jgi:hypothetical protein
MVLLQTHLEVSLDHETLVLRVLRLEDFGGETHLAQLSDGVDELIRGAGKLGFEEGEPEDSGLMGRGKLADGSDLVFADDVLEVNGIQVVGPGMEDAEAVVLHVLPSELLDVCLEELEGGLVSLQGVS